MGGRAAKSAAVAPCKGVAIILAGAGTTGYEMGGDGVVSDFIAPVPAMVALAPSDIVPLISRPLNFSSLMGYGQQQGASTGLACPTEFPQVTLTPARLREVLSLCCLSHVRCPASLRSVVQSIPQSFL